MLGALRFPVSQSRGRRYPEPDHPYRNPFQRDRDRIVHARAFRRLEAKTQVFTPGLSDHFRTRLTHTIEVSQIARTVASALDLDEHLTEALALGHDIGHPPFAHAGEEELNRQMRQFGDSFDHNLHALRIVESFEQRYTGHPRSATKRLFNQAVNRRFPFRLVRWLAGIAFIKRLQETLKFRAQGIPP